MGDAVGWAEDELLLWHLPGLGNGAAQHKGGTLPGHLCDPSKPEAQAAEPGGGERSRTLTTRRGRLVTPTWMDSVTPTEQLYAGAVLGLSLLVTFRGMRFVA